MAAGLCDFSLGSDTGGSVRAPASYCGILGFRPSWGRVSTHGVTPFAYTFDTVGWFARDASLLQRVGQVLLEAPAQDPTSRPLRPAPETDVADASSDAATQQPQQQGPGSDQQAPAEPRWLVASDAFALADEATGKVLYDRLSSRFEQVVGIIGQPTEVDVASGLAAQEMGKLSDWAEVFRVTQVRGGSVIAPPAM